MDESELSLKRAISRFVEVFEIRAQAESQIRSEFEREFQQRPVTKQYINKFVSELIDKILHVSSAMKEVLAERMIVHESQYPVASENRRRWKLYPDTPPHEPDLSIVVHATQVFNNNDLHTLLTGDKDILSVQEIANE